MKTKVLFIQTRETDPLADSMRELQQEDESIELQVIRLSGETPDYNAIVRQTFEADAIHIW